MSKAPSLAFITLSYSGDLNVCRLLCESMDRHVPWDIPHMLFVPKRDLKAFDALKSPRRQLLAQEELLPAWFWKVPLPGPEWRKRLGLPRRNIYLTPYSLPVRGWIAQQVMKIAAAGVLNVDVMMHVDSDTAFVRPVTADRFVHDGRIRLYRNPERVALSSHQSWHEAASRLLGLEPTPFHGAEYIDPIVTWKVPVARSLMDRLSTVSGLDWRIALARAPYFAEYILYGVHADRVIGLDAAGLQATDQSLCHANWQGEFRTTAEEVQFIAAIKPWHVACLLQSTGAMTYAERRALFDRLETAAAHAG